MLSKKAKMASGEEELENMEALNERLHVEMDTDEESCGDSSSNGTNLRRSNSAPMIHLLGISENGPSYSYEQLKRPKPRARTYSATYNQRQSPVPMTLSICVNSGDRSSHAGTPIGSPASRIIQIKQEESIDELTKEVIHERDVTSTMQLSQSLDEMSWLAEKLVMTEEKRDNNEEAPSAFSSPVPTSSPVHLVDQRVSIARSLTPSPGPLPLSPRTRTYRRSLSPSNMRPSALSSKRKLDPDDIDQYATPSPSKRLALYQSSLSTSSNSSCSSPDHPYTSSHLSFDDDSGSDCSWPGTTSYSSSLTFSPLTVHSGNSFPDPKSVPFSFVKPKYVAPPSPLAAGSNSASIQVDPRRNSVGATSYTFTPVRDGHEAQSI